MRKQQKKPKAIDFFPLDELIKPNNDIKIVNSDKVFSEKGCHFYLDYYDKPLSGVVFYNAKYYHYEIQLDERKVFTHEDDNGEITEYVTYCYLDIYYLRPLPDYYSQIVHELFLKYDFSKNSNIYMHCLENGDKYPFDKLDYSLMKINSVCYNMIYLEMED
jgi:hypothetical protein